MSTRPCPVCGAVDTKFLYRPPESPGPVGRCCQCGMVFVTQIEDARALIFEGPVTDKPFPPEVYTSSDLSLVQGAHEFEMLPQKEREQPALRRNADDALDRIARFLPSTTARPEVLDFGSGFGFFLAAAQARGWKCTGVEPLPASAVYARATFGLEILCDTLHDDTFPPASFDVVTAFQVFEHLPFPHADLERLQRFVRPGGVVLIEVPNIATPAITLLRGRHRHFVQDHLNFFAPGTLGEIFRRAGLEPVETFFPSRLMTVGHLSGYWGRKMLPSFVASPIHRSVERAGLQDRLVALNMRDILTVIARKR